MTVKIPANAFKARPRSETAATKFTGRNNSSPIPLTGYLPLYSSACLPTLSM
jgi:hypothetical protein